MGMTRVLINTSLSPQLGNVGDGGASDKLGLQELKLLCVCN